MQHCLTAAFQGSLQELHTIFILQSSGSTAVGVCLGFAVQKLAERM
jgi:hypothetical protein